MHWSSVIPYSTKLSFLELKRKQCMEPGRFLGLPVDAVQTRAYVTGGTDVADEKLACHLLTGIVLKTMLSGFLVTTTLLVLRLRMEVTASRCGRQLGIY
jgi:hypothetical protein